MAILIGSIAVWGIVHSWLASLKVKSFFRGLLDEKAIRAYRFSYNVFAVFSFVPILVLIRWLPDQRLYAVQMPWLLLMLGGQGLAGICLIRALLQTDVLSFIGLRQIVVGEQPSTLVTSGFYGLVRHPLYLFGLLALWLTPAMTVNMLVGYISLTIYAIVGAYFEEHKLNREFGAAYTAYTLRTPPIFPNVISKRT